MCPWETGALLEQQLGTGGDTEVHLNNSLKATDF